MSCGETYCGKRSFLCFLLAAGICTAHAALTTNTSLCGINKCTICSSTEGNCLCTKCYCQTTGNVRRKSGVGRGWADGTSPSELTGCAWVRQISESTLRVCGLNYEGGVCVDNAVPSTTSIIIFVSLVVGGSLVCFFGCWFLGRHIHRCRIDGAGASQSKVTPYSK